MSAAPFSKRPPWPVSVSWRNPIETMTGRSPGKFFSIRTRPGRL